MDKNTFGDSRCEITLAKILTQVNKENISSYVTRFLVAISTHCKNIEFKDNERKTRSVLYRMFKVYYFDQIDNSIGLSKYPEVRSYLKNAALIRLRTHLLRNPK